ncbi:g3680 [Coccomyxa viridis]|uniref:G3680 protein n=1 Tax=Coccomyxa viridis TaxID=1274662 RepID=A0ABP1FNC2_9CHLO
MAFLGRATRKAAKLPRGFEVIPQLVQYSSRMDSSHRQQDGQSIRSSATDAHVGASPPTGHSAGVLKPLQPGMGHMVPPPPPPLSDELPCWWDEVWASPVDVRRRIFCNRSLNMQHIKSIGFDMDYTLSQYRPETFEVLAYNLTVEKLVKNFHYPKDLLDFEFDHKYMMRGLIIDKKRGNILKMDRHKYVKVAFHGFKKLSREERLATYALQRERMEFDEPDFALIDTLFSLAEAHLFMQLIELQDAHPERLPAGKSCADIYRDVRAAVDLCHRDGSLKREVAENPAKYIHEDPRLPKLLEALRASGRKLFLATNSLWDYTHVVMNFLLAGRTGAQRNMDWLEYFDAVITGCGKPEFFIKKKPLFEVHTETGMLMNTDGGTPMVPIGEEDLPSPGYMSSAPKGLGQHQAGQKSRVFQGGFYQDLHKMLDVSSGGEVLYVGDHIYGDILRSKKTLGWRTMLVVPELETELEIQAASAGVGVELKTLRQQRDGLEDQIQRLEATIARAKEGHAIHSKGPHEEPDSVDELEEVVKNLKEQCASVRDRHSKLLQDHHERFHAVWGQLLKTGYQNSRFGHQVERFACLYTSHVSNLCFYSPDKSYRGRMDHMAHEEEPAFHEPPACPLPSSRFAQHRDEPAP